MGTPILYQKIMYRISKKCKKMRRRGNDERGKGQNVLSFRAWFDKIYN
jgi:hypothetical protein